MADFCGFWTVLMYKNCVKMAETCGFWRVLVVCGKSWAFFIEKP